MKEIADKKGRLAVTVFSRGYGLAKQLQKTKTDFMEHSRSPLLAEGPLLALGGRWIHLAVAHACWKGHAAAHGAEIT